MSLIGNEIIPNLHIERINLYDENIETLASLIASPPDSTTSADIGP